MTSFWQRVIALLSIPQNAFPSPTRNAFDQTWVKRWAAIGDSYAAGLGAGVRVDYGCSRYDGGYPSLISSDDRFGAANTTFQYLACSGLKSTEILTKQVPLLKSHLDVITVSAGGNDVALGDVLDSCIFQWRHGNSARCEAALNRSQELIDTVLAKNVDILLDSLMPHLSPKGMVYYPGYAQFFGDSASCKNLSWSVWPKMPPGDKQNLTAERRARMNNMVDQVNQKLRASIAKAGPRVVFIDWDWIFRDAKARFCESPYTEPAPDRKGLLFFEWNTLDDGDDPQLLMRPGDPVPKDSFEGSIGNWVLETLAERPNAIFGPPGSEPVRLFKVAYAHMGRQARFKAQLGFDDLVFWFLPDSWKRVFHPRAVGHHIIAEMILHEMAIQKGRRLGLKIDEYIYRNADDESKLEL